jgi:phosphoribosylglycinamide formyltransferase-1
MKKIAIFASGGGSNAASVMDRLQHSPEISIVKIYTNKATAGVIVEASRRNVECRVFSKNELLDDSILNELIQLQIDWILLAGFLLKIPPSFVKAFPDRIINLHPSLLPLHGGKGMYGHFVHEAVKEAGDKQSGITIHLVNEVYDDGKILRQYKVDIHPTDDAAMIEKKVRELEAKYYAKAIEEIVLLS